MNCECLKKMKEALEAHHQAPVCLSLKTEININTGIMSPCLPPMEYSCMIGKKRKKRFVMFKFCPFCGTSVNGKEQSK